MSGPTWLPPRHLGSPEQPGIAGGSNVSVSMPTVHKPQRAFSPLRSYPEDAGAVPLGPGGFRPLSPGTSDRRYPVTSISKEERAPAAWGPGSPTSASFQVLNFDSIAYSAASPSGPVLRAPTAYKPGPPSNSAPYGATSKAPGYAPQEWYGGPPQRMPQKSYPQPTPAPYATASTPAGSSLNIQVQVAQPVPSYTQPHRRVEQAHGPRAPSRPSYGEQSWYQPLQYPGRPDPTLGTGYGLHGVRRAEPPLYGSGAKPSGTQYQPGSGKTSKEEQGQLRATPEGLVGYQPQGSLTRPEEELDRLTKKLVYDMNHPPAGEYFGRCSRCGENVVGDGTGCIAMEQVFHVECFTCIACRGRLRGQPFYCIDKKSYCEACYIVTLEKCSLCSKPILDRILRAVGKTYHPECFVCVVCRRCLDGVPFTVDATSQIHCIEDFHLKFAPRCSVCGNAIMPEPGQEETVRIVALDRSFHINCYKCEECGLILSSEGEGRGCYPLDGHILCKSCSACRIQELSSKITTDC
ncbi:thyroid receptor-interacting protein 6 isoform X3 [Rhinatrema bivittatum]|uniref:thyroid receptor-interacting protein 6 isoform X3 n=1 Tax=Rhinatrema bivittatum TaxID=194408 RepID=UPI00112D459B|nr:thyroid receptor-interacting protein 6 isoform X3 [Rhinatrema bivittatum]